MPKFVRFSPTYNQNRSVWVNVETVTHVQAEGDVDGNPTCFIGNGQGGVFVIGTASEVVEKLEAAR